MKNFLRWVFVYSFFGVVSASLGYLIGYETQTIAGWWVPVIMLPFTNFLTFISFAIIYDGLTLIVIGSGIALFLVSSVTFAIARRQIFLIGVALGSTIMSWPSVKLFYMVMSV